MLPIEEPRNRQWPTSYARRVTHCKAMRLDSANSAQVVAWIGGDAHEWAGRVIVPLPPAPGSLQGGEMAASPGDWVVQVGPHWAVWNDQMFTREWVPMVEPHTYTSGGAA